MVRKNKRDVQLNKDQRERVERYVLQASSCSVWMPRDVLIRHASAVCHKSDETLVLYSHDFSLAIDRLARRGQLEVEKRGRGCFQFKVFRYPLPF